MQQPLRIRADDRERVSGEPDLLSAHPGVKLIVERLALGDYLVEDEVLIERKSSGDFASSLLHGRLFAQANRLTASRYRPAYLIVGQAAEWKALGVPRHALQGALITLILVYDIPLFRALDAEEASRLILYIGQQRARLRDPHLVACRPGKPRRKRTRQLRLLQNLPGIGPRRAAALLEHFGSVRCCIAAPVEELTQIQGIGPKTATRIVEIVREPRATYGSDERASWSSAPLPL